MWITTQALAAAELESLVGSGGAFDGAKLGLIKTLMAPGPLMVLADLDPCDFTGYALSAAIEWGDVFHSGPAEVMVPGDYKEFIATDGAVPNTVYGAYLVDGAGTTLLAVELFEESVPVVEEGQGLVVWPLLVLPSQLLG